MKKCKHLKRNIKILRNDSTVNVIDETSKNMIIKCSEHCTLLEDEISSPFKIVISRLEIISDFSVNCKLCFQD